MQNGLRANTAWYSIKRGNRTKGGVTRFFPCFIKELRSFSDGSRLRALKDEPYTQKEAEAATGLRTDNGSRKASALTKLEEKAASMELET